MTFASHTTLPTSFHLPLARSSWENRVHHSAFFLSTATACQSVASVDPGLIPGITEGGLPDCRFRTVDRDQWCATFAEVLAAMDPSTDRVEAEWTAQVIYPSATLLTPVQAVRAYLGLNERRQQPRDAESDDTS